jgi:hypothetical protein
MVQLPPELIDTILDHLHDDKLALSACSLVRKTWTHTARYHLFADVNIESESGCTNLLRLLRPGSAAIPYIRRLRIMVNVGCRFWNETLPSLANFERIQSVSIAYLPWGYMTLHARSTFLNHFTTATRLYLHEGIATLTSLAHMIAAFSRLDTLIINNIDLDLLGWDDVQPSLSTLRPPRDLHALELRRFDASVLLSWLGSSGISLRSVSLRGISTNKIQPFLDAIGPSLEELWCEPRFGFLNGTSSPQ